MSSQLWKTRVCETEPWSSLVILTSSMRFKLSERLSQKKIKNKKMKRNQDHQHRPLSSIYVCMDEYIQLHIYTFPHKHIHILCYVPTHTHTPLSPNLNRPISLKTSTVVPTTHMTTAGSHSTICSCMHELCGSPQTPVTVDETISCTQRVCKISYKGQICTTNGTSPTHGNGGMKILPYLPGVSQQVRRKQSWLLKLRYAQTPWVPAPNNLHLDFRTLEDLCP